MAQRMRWGRKQTTETMGSASAGNRRLVRGNSWKFLGNDKVGSGSETLPGRISCDAMWFGHLLLLFGQTLVCSCGVRDAAGSVHVPNRQFGATTGRGRAAYVPISGALRHRSLASDNTVRVANDNHIPMRSANTQEHSSIVLLIERAVRISAASCGDGR